MGKLSRDKGAAWERECCAMLHQATGREFKRSLEEVREGNTGDIQSDMPIAFQCKVGAEPRVWQAVSEAVDAALPHEYAVALVRRNQRGKRDKQDIAVIPLDDFMEILGMLALEKVL